MSLLVAKLVLRDGCAADVPYDSVVDALSDSGLWSMFAEGRVSRCEIYAGNKRLAGLPRMTWEHFREALLDHAKTILETLASPR